jgi:hypothetical protein
MMLGTFEVAEIKSFLSKVKSIAKEGDVLNILNDRDTNTMYFDFQFDRVIGNKRYDPIHLVGVFESISSFDGEWEVDAKEFIKYADMVQDESDIFDLLIEDTENEFEVSIEIREMVSADESFVGELFYGTRISNKKPSEIYLETNYENEIPELNSRWSNKLEAMYKSDSGDLMLLFDVGFSNNIPSEICRVLGTFIRKYNNMQLETKEQEVGAQARQEMNENVDKTSGSETAMETNRNNTGEEAGVGSTAGQDGLETADGDTAEEKDISANNTEIVSNTPKSKSKRKRRTAEEILLDSINEAKELLEINGYKVLREEKAPDTDTLPADPMDMMEVVNTAMAKVLIPDAIDPTTALKIVKNLHAWASCLMANAIESAGSVGSEYIKLSSLKGMEVMDLLKLVQDG